MRKLVVLLALGLAGCAPPPRAWDRIDGGPLNGDDFAATKVICQGELDKAALGRTGQMGLFPTIAAENGVFAGCMAQHGYIAAN